MAPKKAPLSEMKIVEDALEVELCKVRNVEEKLRTGLLTTEALKKLTDELQEVKSILYGNERALKDLRSQKKRLFVLGAGFIFVLLLLLRIYSMVFRRF